MYSLSIHPYMYGIYSLKGKRALLPMALGPRRSKAERQKVGRLYPLAA